MRCGFAFVILEMGVEASLNGWVPVNVPFDSRCVCGRKLEGSGRRRLTVDGGMGSERGVWLSLSAGKMDDEDGDRPKDKDEDEYAYEHGHPDGRRMRWLGGAAPSLYVRWAPQAVNGARYNPR